MPDLTPLRAHERDLTRIEQRLQTQGAHQYTMLRNRLRDALDTHISGLQQVLPGAFDAARRSLRTLTNDAAAQTVRQAATFAQAELSGIGAVFPHAPSTAVLQQAAIAQALAWLDAVEGLMLAEAAQLGMVATPPSVAIARLVAVSAIDGRTSVWASGLVPLELAIARLIWGLANTTRAAYYQAASEQGGQRFRKQVIAAIDGRTTSCCLRAHGQIQDLDEPFVLTGTPRYSDRLMGPPFHYRCRTSMVLYTEAMEDVGPTTAQLRAAARAEASRR